MILSDEELDARLSHPDNLAVESDSNSNSSSTFSVEQIHKGGRKSDGIPPRVRTLIGGLSITSPESQKSIAETFNIGQSSVSQFSRGLVHNRRDDELSDEIGEVKKSTIESAHEQALECLMDSLTTLAPRIQEETNPNKLARIAKDMASVTAQLKPKEEREKVNLNVVVMTVPQKKLESYETIDV